MQNLMKAIEANNVGGPEVLRLGSMTVPEATGNEVLIEVAAAGINRPDVLQRRGLYAPPHGASTVLGLEVSGVIVKVGEGVTRWKMGDHVVALVSGGGYAEYCVAPEGQCLPVPHGLNLIEAAALPETYFTVWANVFMLGHLKEGESILVHGGSSGIGTTAIQLAKVFGAKVFVTAGSDQKCAACLALGADQAVNYRLADFFDEITRYTEGAGVDVILDIVGQQYFAKNVACLSLGGRLLQIAVPSGSEVNLDLLQIMTRRLTISGSTLRPRTISQKTEIANQLEKFVWPLIEGKKLKPVIDSVYSFADVRAAHERMESSEHVGKIVLSLSD